MQFKIWFGIFMRLQGWWALGLGAVCLGLTLFSVYDYQLAARFDRDGVMVPVRVARLWTTISHGRHGSTNHFHAEFIYTVGNQHLDREEEISAHEYYQFDLTQVVAMRVLPDDPTELETTKGETLGIAKGVQWMALGLGLGALGLGWWFGQEAALMVLARKFGHTAQGTVTQIAEITNKGKPSGKGRLSWWVEGSLISTSLPHPMGSLLLHPVGSQVEVFVRKGRSFWAQDVGARDTLSYDLPDVRRPG